MAGGGQGYLFLVLSPFARRGILFVSGLFRLPYFPSRLPVSSQQSRKHTPRYSSTYIKAKRQQLSRHDHVLPQVDHRRTITHILVNMTPAHPQAASRPRLILRSDSFTHEDLSAAFAASASQPRTKDLKIRIAQKDETPAPPPSPTEAFSSHRP
ncbi:hypothetical protein D6D21_09751 [Aureobasidium pullulans]|uniref:Uncharacterized protein n=1 Tax=Aureobasidium pullulans TaxID=5580 RepID=A0AB74IK42_AURPU|nr:hypothetical protein D6D21_09751 [Aureobasidium pullulans]